MKISSTLRLIFIEINIIYKGLANILQRGMGGGRGHSVSKLGYAPDLMSFSPPVMLYVACLKKALQKGGGGGGGHGHPRTPLATPD